MDTCAILLTIYFTYFLLNLFLYALFVWEYDMIF